MSLEMKKRIELEIVHALSRAWLSLAHSLFLQEELPGFRYAVERTVTLIRWMVTLSLFSESYSSTPVTRSEVLPYPVSEAAQSQSSRMVLLRGLS